MTRQPAIGNPETLINFIYNSHFVHMMCHWLRWKLLQLKSLIFSFETKQCVNCYLSWPDHIPAHVDSGDVIFQDLVRIGKFKNLRLSVHIICTWSMPIAKAGGLRRPTAQKRLDSGAIGRKTWFTVQSGLDLDDWWVTQRHLEAVSTILPGGSIYYLTWR